MVLCFRSQSAKNLRLCFSESHQQQRLHLPQVGAIRHTHTHTQKWTKTQWWPNMDTHTGFYWFAFLRLHSVQCLNLIWKNKIFCLNFRKQFFIFKFAFFHFLSLTTNNYFLCSTYLKLHLSELSVEDEDNLYIYTGKFKGHLHPPRSPMNQNTKSWLLYARGQYSVIFVINNRNTMTVIQVQKHTVHWTKNISTLKKFYKVFFFLCLNISCSFVWLKMSLLLLPPFLWS